MLRHCTVGLFLASCAVAVVITVRENSSTAQTRTSGSVAPPVEGGKALKPVSSAADFASCAFQ